jgi:uncharacterized membrane protein YdjX (TVP38/TMEM64 family)
MDSGLDRLRGCLGAVRLFASRRARRRFLVHAAVVVAVVAVVATVAGPYLAVLGDAAALRAFVGRFGVWAPFVFVFLQAVQVVVAPVPGQLLAVAAGYLFGPWWGTLYNVAGITLGSTAAFWLSRRFGRAYVERIVHEDALARFDAFGDGYARPALFVAFLVPGLPDDLLCFVGGLTTVPLWQLVVLAAVGRTPAFFLANVVGGFLGAGRIDAALALAGVLVALSAIGYLHRDRLVGLLGGGR